MAKTRSRVIKSGIIKSKTEKPGAKKIIFFVIVVLIFITIVYSFKDRISDNNINTRIRITDSIIYPGSTEKLYTENEDRITINYQTGQSVSNKELISFYEDKMPKLGWKLVSVSDYDIVFEKDTRKVRIWVLYADTENNENSVIDYIIDYTSSNNPVPPAI